MWRLSCWTKHLSIINCVCHKSHWLFVEGTREMPTSPSAYKKDVIPSALCRRMSFLCHMTKLSKHFSSSTELKVIMMIFHTSSLWEQNKRSHHGYHCNCHHHLQHHHRSHRHHHHHHHQRVLVTRTATTSERRHCDAWTHTHRHTHRASRCRVLAFWRGGGWQCVCD